MPRSAAKTAVCKLEGCDTVCYSGPRAMRPTGMSLLIRGMCNFHYHRQVQGINANAPKRGSAKDGCVISDCTEPWYCRDWCQLHYERRKRGFEMTAPKKRPPGSPLWRDELGRKYCSTCRQWVSEANFHGNVLNIDGLASACADCCRDRNKRFGYNSPAYTHKIGEERYRELVAAGCEACGAVDGLHVDHDHACCPGSNSCGKCVRGCLCGPCNLALGLLGDDADRISGLLRYLTKCPAI